MIWLSPQLKMRRVPKSFFSWNYPLPNPLAWFSNKPPWEGLPPPFLFKAHVASLGSCVHKNLLVILNESFSFHLSSVNIGSFFIYVQLFSNLFWRLVIYLLIAENLAEVREEEDGGWKWGGCSQVPLGNPSLAFRLDEWNSQLHLLYKFKFLFLKFPSFPPISYYYSYHYYLLITTTTTSSYYYSPIVLQK